MSEAKNYKINSYDEWSPLKEVIVGVATNYHTNDIDLSFKIFHNDNMFGTFCYPEYKTSNDQTIEEKHKNKINKIYLDELNEDVEELANTLKSLGIRVFRPMPLSKNIKVTTPYWESTCIPALNVRDQTIIIGDEILETSIQMRSRYFENDLLKKIFYHYFELGSKWTCMPSPVMTDKSFDLSYVKSVNRDMIATQAIYQQEPSEFDVDYEMMIDGAQCIRFGKDILVNVSTVNHEKGYQWLKKHVGSKFNLHKVNRLSDSHIDSVILPLRPGTLLLRDPKFLDQLPEALKKWQIIYPPEPKNNYFPNYTNEDLILTSKYIDLNVLSIDEERVIVNSLCPELIKVLEKNKFTPIPVRHRHRRIFGGGFHCFTLDTVREGGIESYF